MVQIKPNHKIPLIQKIDEFTIFSYESLSLNPNENKTIYLPYFIENQDKRGYINFELSKNLINKNIICLFHNLNEESSKNGLMFILFNLKNVAKSDILSNILGEANKVNIKPLTELGKIFF